MRCIHFMCSCCCIYRESLHFMVHALFGCHQRQLSVFSCPRFLGFKFLYACLELYGTKHGSRKSFKWACWMDLVIDIRSEARWIWSETNCPDCHLVFWKAGNNIVLGWTKITWDLEGLCLCCSRTWEGVWFLSQIIKEMTVNLL